MKKLKRGHIKCPYCSTTPISIAKDEVVDIIFDGKQLKMDIQTSDSAATYEWIPLNFCPICGRDLNKQN